MAIFAGRMVWTMQCARALPLTYTCRLTLSDNCQFILHMYVCVRTEVYDVRMCQWIYWGVKRFSTIHLPFSHSLTPPLSHFPFPACRPLAMTERKFKSLWLVRLDSTMEKRNPSRNDRRRIKEWTRSKHAPDEEFFSNLKLKRKVAKSANKRFTLYWELRVK